MDKIWHNLKLDLADGGSQGAIYVRARDTGTQVLSIQLRTNGKAYKLTEDVVATIRGRRQDGTEIYNTCYIEDNCVRVELTTDMLAAAGLTECVLQLVGTDPAVLTTPGFDIYVEDAPEDGGVEGTSEFTSLVEQTAKTKALQLEIEQKLADGEFDGYSPEVTVTPITGGHRVTITDAEGESTFEVMDGKDGTGGSGGGGTADHTQLTNRDAADQHPISAVTGLQDVLDGKMDDDDVPEWAMAAEKPAYTYTEVGAAPKGLGIGENIYTLPALDDINLQHPTGWYHINTSTSNLPTGEFAAYMRGALFVMLVQRTHQQIFYSRMSPYPIFVRTGRGSSSSIEWEPWEWVSPYLNVGVEYRTTERYMGKPVYVQLVNFGYLPNNSSASVSIADDGLAFPVRAYLLVGGSLTSQGTAIGNQYPYIKEFYTGANNITITTNIDVSATQAKVQIYYTKE